MNRTIVTKRDVERQHNRIALADALAQSVVEYISEMENPIVDARMRQISYDKMVRSVYAYEASGRIQ
jgi:hypothetical protein